jgi:hypothetical protein
VKNIFSDVSIDINFAFFMLIFFYKKPAQTLHHLTFKNNIRLIHQKGVVLSKGENFSPVERTNREPSDFIM